MTARVLTAVGIFALALAVRLLPFSTVIGGGRVIFFGMDAWYHMRRVQMTLVQGGWPPTFDPYLNFPHGAMPIWPPLFDALVACWIWPAEALSGWLAAEQAAALLPPVLGALCVVVLYRLALRLFDFEIAIVASLGLCFLSAHFWYSQIGFVDHHAAVALVSTALLASSVTFIDELSGNAPRGAPWRSAASTGVLSGFSLLLWPGMVAHVGVAMLALGIAWLSVSEKRRALRGAQCLTLSGALALAIVLPSGWRALWTDWSAFSPAVLSLFQPWLFAVLASLTGVCSLLWRRSSAGASRALRIAQALAVGLALVAASFLVFPELSSGVAEAWRWFTKDEIFQGLVNESKPLFFARGSFDVGIAELRLSRLVYFLPVVLAFLAWRARRSANRAGLLLLVAWLLILAIATLLQRRFFNSLAPAYALAMAWGIVTLLRELSARIPKRRVGLFAASRVVQVATVALCMALFASTLSAYRLPLNNLAAGLLGGNQVAPKSEITRRVLYDVASWLNDNTPPTASPLDPNAKPEYGILAPWGYGHMLKYVARRPTIVGNFGDDVGEANLRRAAAYSASREPDAVRILDDLRARYVLIGTLGDVPTRRLHGDAMRKRLSIDDSPGLQHHRLLYESPLDERWAQIGRSEFRLFERVAGARLSGVAEPGQRVVARLGYQSNRGRRGRFQSATIADSQGRYEIRLPYATRGAPPGVVTDGAYLVSSGGRSGIVSVREQDVQSGRVLPGPSFAVAGPAASGESGAENGAWQPPSSDSGDS